MINLDNLTIEQRVEAEKILAELEQRKLRYPILDVTLHDYQQEFDEALKARKPDGTPKYKFIIFLGWNGSGKTWYASYATMRMAMWYDLCKQFGIPPVGEASLIKVYTTTGDNIRDNIDRKYLLGTGRPTDALKFPGYLNKDDTGPVVKKPRWDKEILKEIKLHNGSVMTFGTYDQGQARLQGWEPQFTWMDELPTRYEDLIEIFRGTRNANGQLLISATPTNYNKKIHDYLFSEKFEDVLFVRQVDSLRNTKGDHSWMEGLSEDDIKVRRFGSFTPPEGLVYPNFNREFNVVEHIHPKKLWSRVRFYGAVDFGFNHPMAFLFIAVDDDWHVYVFDMIYKSRMYLKDLANEVKDKLLEYWISLDYVVADSAGAQERHELKGEWIPTVTTNKRAKVNDTSFRAGGILKINQMLALQKIIISEKCEPLIEEFLAHHFKENWDVQKTEDDALDALRYFIMKHIEYSEKNEQYKMRKKRAKKAQKKRRY